MVAESKTGEMREQLNNALSLVARTEAENKNIITELDSAKNEACNLYLLSF